jgi:hypothetical protein
MLAVDQHETIPWQLVRWYTQQTTNHVPNPFILYCSAAWNRRIPLIEKKKF